MGNRNDLSYRKNAILSFCKYEMLPEIALEIIKYTFSFDWQSLTDEELALSAK